MPRRDGTGPIGRGAMTGRGLGLCNSFNNPTYGYGRGFGLGRGNCRRNPIHNESSKDSLAQQKKVLEARLEEINKELSN